MHRIGVLLLFLAGVVLTFLTPRSRDPSLRPVEPSLYGSPAIVAPSLSLSTNAEPAAAVDTAVFTAFADWVSRWTSADRTTRATLESEGVRLALARRDAMRRLLRTRPERAEQWTIPYAQRVRLPASVQVLLESVVITAR